MIAWASVMVFALLGGGCNTSPSPDSLSYEAQMKRAETALQQHRLFEAKRWTHQALQKKPADPPAQALMARLIERELIREKSLNPLPTSKETDSDPKDLQIKTWIERSRSLLEIHQFEEALWAAEQVFLLDAENPDASRLIDEIKQRAREEGRDEEHFLEELYQGEISARIQNYLRQAETFLEEKRWGAARFAVEKALLLDSRNEKAEGLLTVLNKREESA